MRTWDLTGHVVFGHLDKAKYADWSKRMEGVSTLRLTFLDDKLAAIVIYYEPTTQLNNSLEFTAAVAKGLSLPRQGWVGRGPTTLYCAGFTVETDAVSIYPSLVIKLHNLEGEMVTRKYENLRKKREAFKP